MRFFVLLLLFVLIPTVFTVEIKDAQYPFYWQTAPSSLADYPLSNSSSSNQSRLIDPWLYQHRLGLYKILIDVTTPYMPFCSSPSSNASNILFGLPSQFSWQYKSNRLFSNGTMKISSDSWWASANYYLSVIPFLAAVDVGLIRQGPFEIVRQGNFCSNSSECHQQAPKAMLKWHRFFSNLQQANYCSSYEKNDPHALDQCYLGPMWTAQKASIDNALPLIESKSILLPSKVEQEFGLGWARLVNLIAMSRKNTDLHETNKYQHAYLPSRMLRDSDRTSKSSDLPDSVNQALALLFACKIESLPTVEKIWQRITCNYEGRKYSQHTLEKLAVSKRAALNDLFRAMFNAFFFKCDPPSIPS